MSVIDDGVLTWNYQGYWTTNAGYGPAWLELLQNLNQRCDFMGEDRPTVPLMQPDPDVDPVTWVGLCSSAATPGYVFDMITAMQASLNTLETNAAWCDDDGTEYSGFDLTALDGHNRTKLLAIVQHMIMSLDAHRYATSTAYLYAILFHGPTGGIPDPGYFGSWAEAYAFCNPVAWSANYVPTDFMGMGSGEASAHLSGGYYPTDRYTCWGRVSTVRIYFSGLSPSSLTGELYGISENYLTPFSISIGGNSIVATNPENTISVPLSFTRHDGYIDIDVSESISDPFPSEMSDPPHEGKYRFAFRIVPA